MAFHRPAMIEGDTLPVTSAAAATIFTTLLGEGPMPRVELARVVGLSQAAVTRVVRPLIDLGYLVETTDSRKDAGMGRPVSPLQVVPERQFFLGVKVTADELIGVLVDLQAQVRAVEHVALESTEAGFVVAAIARLVDELRIAYPVPLDRIGGLGVTVTGDVDRASGVARHAPLLRWREVPLAQLVADATGLSTVVENDVRALTTMERWFGAGVGVHSFALVTIGAGIGCGLLINGEVVSGAHGVAGEIGHLPLVADDRVCTCGRRGCVETVASTDSIMQDVRALPGRADATIREAVQLAHEGDLRIREVFDRAGGVIGRALAVVANLVGPERIILSGERIADYDLYEALIRQSLLQHAFGSAAHCELIVRPLSFDEWARAAAVAALESFVVPEEKKAAS